jgi:hypothetical protein
MNEICAPHLARTGVKIPASRVVGEEAMCKSCFEGKPIRLIETQGDDLRWRHHDAERVREYRARRVSASAGLARQG